MMMTDEKQLTKADFDSMRPGAPLLAGVVISCAEKYDQHHACLLREDDDHADTCPIQHSCQITGDGLSLTNPLTVYHDELMARMTSHGDDEDPMFGCLCRCTVGDIQEINIAQQPETRELFMRLKLVAPELAGARYIVTEPLLLDVTLEDVLRFGSERPLGTFVWRSVAYTVHCSNFQEARIIQNYLDPRIMAWQHNATHRGDKLGHLTCPNCVGQQAAVINWHMRKILRDRRQAHMWDEDAKVTRQFLQEHTALEKAGDKEGALLLSTSHHYHEITNKPESRKFHPLPGCEDLHQADTKTLHVLQIQIAAQLAQKRPR